MILEVFSNSNDAVIVCCYDSMEFWFSFLHSNFDPYLLVTEKITTKPEAYSKLPQQQKNQKTQKNPPKQKSV